MDVDRLARAAIVAATIPAYIAAVRAGIRVAFTPEEIRRAGLIRAGLIVKIWERK